MTRFQSKQRQLRNSLMQNIHLFLMKPDRKSNEDQLGSNDRRRKKEKGILQEFFIKRRKKGEDSSTG